MSRKRKAEPVTRADAGHPTPPAPHPVGRKKARRPAEPPPAPPLTTEAHHVVSKGIVCPNQECRARVCGPVPAEVRAKRSRHRPKFTVYTRYRPSSIYRIRVCLRCGRRFRTVERIESNAS
jgi:hypothetical protein